jgi:predicted transport protein
MQLYLNQNGVLQEIIEKPFKLERDLQKLFEANLEPLMGLKVVKSEFSIKNARIDTLAFNSQSKAFTVIEYKRDKNFSVIDQGFMYLALMLEAWAEVLLEYNAQAKNPMRRNDVDWSQSRAVFVAPSFTDVQVQSTNFRDLPIELWEVVQYANNTIIVKQTERSKAAGSFNTIAAGNAQIKKVADIVKVITEDQHLAYAGETMSELYQKFRTAILNLSDGIEVKPQKAYIAFKKKHNIVDIEIQKKSLKLWINARFGSLDDPKHIAKDVSKLGHYGNGDYEIKIKNDGDLEYIMSLVKQAMKKV